MIGGYHAKDHIIVLEVWGGVKGRVQKNTESRNLPADGLTPIHIPHHPPKAGAENCQWTFSVNEDLRP